MSIIYIIINSDAWCFPLRLLYNQLKGDPCSKVFFEWMHATVARNV